MHTHAYIIYLCELFAMRLGEVASACPNIPDFEPNWNLLYHLRYQKNILGSLWDC